jgi:60 kDa SS-A/Ro ribonucleoprotein
VKYQRREGFTGQDVLRLAHPRPPTPKHDAVFRWMTKGWDAVPETSPEPALDRIWAFERAKRVESAEQVVDLSERFRLPREAVPTHFLDNPEVWQALLTAGGGMPFTALLRNLGKLGSVGLLAPGSTAINTVVQRLGDVQRLRRAWVHPLAVLIALMTYRRGCGIRQVVDALDAAKSAFVSR